MNLLTIEPGRIFGETSIPPSKSQTHRALIFASMARGNSRIDNVLHSPDTTALIRSLQHLGVKFNRIGGSLVIQGLGGSIKGADGILDVGNSGIALRFLTALSALSERPVVLTGDDSLCHHRPIGPLLDALSQLNVRVETVKGNGYAPVIVKGPLKGGKAIIEGHDSQPVSALIIASLFSERDTELIVKNSGEHPWIDLTLEWLDRLQLKYQKKDYDYYSIQGRQRFDGFDYTVPGDWSSAAFPAAAALVTSGRITLRNLEKNSSQGDKKLFDHFRQMGASVIYDESENSVEVSTGGPLNGISVDINDCIDAITILAVVACYAQGETRIYNGAVARQKECDRIRCVAAELAKMGASVVESDDGLIIRGGGLKGASLCSYKDHRMAMSLAVAALGADGRSTIDDTACVAKTYPSFFADLKLMGARIT